MANQKECSITNPTNYREPENDNEDLRVQQLLSGTLQIDQYPPIRELQRIRADSDQALANSHFSTPQERKIAESCQCNIHAWIDTGKNVLESAVHCGGLSKF